MKLCDVCGTIITRSYFSERNSVSFPESIESEKGWRSDILCMRSPGVKGICADALLCDSLILVARA